MVSYITFNFQVWNGTKTETDLTGETNLSIAMPALTLLLSDRPKLYTFTF